MIQGNEDVTEDTADIFSLSHTHAQKNHKFNEFSVDLKIQVKNLFAEIGHIQDVKFRSEHWRYQGKAIKPGK